MRLSLSLLIIGACVAGPVALAQTAASQSQPAGTQHPAHPSRHSPSAPAPARHPAHPGKGSTAPAKAGGVLALGATDITGNKELPKVMVIVPWKGSLGADGVVRPTDSLMDEVLTPVDRSVFQRQVRYYGQLNGGGGAPAGGRVAPVGDSH